MDRFIIRPFSVVLKAAKSVKCKVKNTLNLQTNKMENETTTVDETHSTAETEELSICAICLAEILVEDFAFVYNCMHIYCLSCINKWIRIKPTCPMCKQLAKMIVFDIYSHKKYKLEYIAAVNNDGTERTTHIEIFNEENGEHGRFERRNTKEIINKLRNTEADLWRISLERRAESARGSTFLERPIATTLLAQFGRSNYASNETVRNAYLNYIENVERLYTAAVRIQRQRSMLLDGLVDLHRVSPIPGFNEAIANMHQTFRINTTNAAFDNISSTLRTEQSLQATIRTTLEHISIIQNLLNDSLGIQNDATDTQ